MKTEMQLSGALTKVWCNKSDFGSYSGIYTAACLRTVASIYEMDIALVYEEYEKICNELEHRNKKK